MPGPVLKALLVLSYSILTVGLGGSCNDFLHVIEEDAEGQSS